MSDRRVGPPPKKPAASSLIRSVRESTNHQVPAPPVPEPTQLQTPSGEVQVPHVEATSAPAQMTGQIPTQNADVKITVTVGEERRSKLRTAYTLTHREENHRTFSEFVSSIIDGEITRLEKKYNGGQKFTNAEDGVMRGRPLGS